MTEEDKPISSAVNGITDDDSALDASSSKPPRVKFSEQSQPLINEAHRLLAMKPTGTPTINPDSIELDTHELTRSSTTTSLRPSNPYRLTVSPSFGRVDFEDIVNDSISKKKPAWKELQESIKDSYYKPKHFSERQEELRDFQESLYNRRSTRRSVSPFAYLPRQTSYSSFETTRSPYAAPAVSSTQGIESQTYGAEARYDKLVNDMEARLLKTTYGLSGRHRSTSVKEYRRAPEPASGSMTEACLDEAESLVMPRTYYSRPNRRDPDYFDFDLQHSVDLYRKPLGRYVPKGPAHWESKILGDYKTKGDAPLSGHMFTNGETDYRNTGSSLLSAALRTPSFWEHRFSTIGSQVRESNPVSFASIERRRYSRYR
uniref:SoHo domain-containing protein n=1 Tax=Panagrellus redivivus TaxID=6233 RepID=A0A7E4VZC9_PANRE